jgi:tripartite-type tricarboxylate transporter receptor subunit TctC
MIRLPIGALALAFMLSPGVALAQDWPAKQPIKVIVPFTAGSATDIAGRIVFEQVGKQIGQNFVFENRGGAGTTLGAAMVAKADPDGYTLLQAAANMSINPIMVADMPFDTIKDFAPVTLTHLTPYVFLVSSQSPVKSLPELFKFIKDNPGKINYGITGPGSPHQLATLLMAQMAGPLGTMTEVTYKGSTAAHPDLIANRISFMIDPLAAAAPHIRSGLLRGLAVSTPQRNPSFPDIPAAAEIMPGYQFSSWGGVFAPARTPRAIVLKLNAEIGTALATPDIQKRFTDMGLVPKHSTPEEFGSFLQAEIARWRALLNKKP